MMTTTTRLDAFRQEIEKAGLTPPALIIADGTLHRFASNGDRADDSGWYTYFPDEPPAGVFGCFRNNVKQTWSGKTDSTLTPAERDRQRRRLDEARRQREQDEQLRHAEAAKRARTIWDQAAPAPEDHPYLTRKSIQPHGLRVDDENRLIVPVTIDGTLRSLQFIDANGGKRFLPGGKVRGGIFTLGEVTKGSTVLLGEGFATAASLYEASALPTVMAFSANNLHPVAEQLSRQYRAHRILVCGDNDIRGDGQPNTGLDAATAAANAIGGGLVMPNLDGQKCDWNDVHTQRGLGAVKEAITTAMRREEMRAMSTAASPADTHTDSWPQLDEVAFYGLAGEFTKAVESYSEADPLGILLHVLLPAGALIGPLPHVLVEHTPHNARTNALLIGTTAGGRKGTAWSTPRYVFTKVDETFVLKRVKSGLSSGEGLIFQVRDPQYDQVPIREGGRRTGEILSYEDVLSDQGEPDKRLLIIESEFSSALKVMDREGNTLSPVLRDVWDHGNLSPLTKKDRMVATGAHVCIIGHITVNELLRCLAATDRANGFANRYLFAVVRQSKFIPSGKGTPPQILEPFFLRFSRTLERARTRGLMARDQEIETLWASVYRKLAEAPQGLTGAILARGAAQVLRLSLIYALLDEAEASRTDTAIRVPHLLAALAVWDYCTASTYQIFGDAVGDPIADRLLRLIKSGLQTDTELYESLGKHEGDRNRKGHALDLLQRLDHIHRASIPTAGRAITEWHVGVLLGCAICAQRG
jgi:phage/plasmid primase-like uncharacterized protein